jgi:hypothetical protein
VAADLRRDDGVAASVVLARRCLVGVAVLNQERRVVRRTNLVDVAFVVLRAGLDDRRRIVGGEALVDLSVVRWRCPRKASAW